MNKQTKLDIDISFIESLLLLIAFELSSNIGSKLMFGIGAIILTCLTLYKLFNSMEGRK